MYANKNHLCSGEIMLIFFKPLMWVIIVYTNNCLNKRVGLLETFGKKLKKYSFRLDHHLLDIHGIVDAIIHTIILNSMKLFDLKEYLI